MAHRLLVADRGVQGEGQWGVVADHMRITITPQLKGEGDPLAAHSLFDPAAVRECLSQQLVPIAPAAGSQDRLQPGARQHFADLAIFVGQPVENDRGAIQLLGKTRIDHILRHRN